MEEQHPQGPILPPLPQGPLLPPLPPKPCPRCANMMSPWFVSNATDDRGKRLTEDVRGYKCDVCGYQEKVVIVNEHEGLGEQQQPSTTITTPGKDIKKEMDRYQDKMRKSAFGDSPLPAGDSTRSEK